MDEDEGEKPVKVKRPQQVYTLLVEVGRKAGDGLPEKATGAALMIYASGVDEAEAVRETVAILKEADLCAAGCAGVRHAGGTAEGGRGDRRRGARADGPGAGRKLGHRGADDAVFRLKDV